MTKNLEEEIEFFKRKSIEAEDKLLLANKINRKIIRCLYDILLAGESDKLIDIVYKYELFQDGLLQDIIEIKRILDLRK